MFEDRVEAGRVLASQLEEYQKASVVIAIPRGGVVIGDQIARKLHVPLSVVIARKMGATHNPELGIGAISEEGVMILDPKLIRALDITAEQIDEIEKKEKNEIKRRVRMYRNSKALRGVQNQVVILVDDGLATGVTAKAAVITLQKFHPKKIILAVPVCSTQTVESLADNVEIVCTLKRSDLQAIGLYYKDFHQVSDKEVIQLLKKNNKHFFTKQLPFRFS